MEQSKFMKEIEQFLKSMNGHLILIISCMPLLTGKIKNINKKINKIHSKARKIKKDKETFYTCSINNKIKCDKIKKIGDPIDKAIKMMPKDIFCSMYNTFENHISNLYKITLLTHPNAVDTFDKKYSYSDIVNFKSIKKFKNKVINDTLFSFTYKSFSEQIDNLEKKYKVDLIEKDEVFFKLLKLSLQRNLFTHNSGIINSLYLEKCREFNCRTDDEEKIDMPLHFCVGCFLDAYETIILSGLKIGQNLWRKLFKEEIDVADEVLIKTGYDLLEDGKYELAKVFLEYSCSIKSLRDQKIKKILTINKALAYYLSNDKKRCKKIISEYDWSDNSIMFEMALHSLNEDFIKVKDLIIKMGTKSEVDPLSYYKWPLFKKFRETKYFNQAMRKIGIKLSDCPSVYDIPGNADTIISHKK